VEARGRGRCRGDGLFECPPSRIELVKLLLQPGRAQPLGDGVDSPLSFRFTSSSSRRCAAAASSTSCRCRFTSAWNSRMNSATRSGAISRPFSASRMTPSSSARLRLFRLEQVP
jgi:hypothetical protein